MFITRRRCILKPNMPTGPGIMLTNFPLQSCLIFVPHHFVTITKGPTAWGGCFIQKYWILLLCELLVKCGHVKLPCLIYIDMPFFMWNFKDWCNVSCKMFLYEILIYISESWSVPRLEAFFINIKPKHASVTWILQL